MVDKKSVVVVPHFPNSPYLDLYQGALEKRGWHFINSSMSPRSLRRVDAQVVHVHWLHPLHARIGQANTSRGRLLGSAKSLASILWFFVFLRRMQGRGSKIIWTAHNLRAHESAFEWLDTAITRLMIRAADIVIAHSDGARQALIKEFGASESHVVVVPHPPLRIYGELTEPAVARAKLGIEDIPTIVFFGQIRPYKGVDKLIQAFQSESLKSAHVQLLVCGSCERNYRAYLEGLAADLPRVHLSLKRIDDADVRLILSSATAMALPYSAITTSGVGVLIQSYRLPCIATNLEYFRESFSDHPCIFYDQDEQGGLPNSILRAIDEFSTRRHHDPVDADNRATAQVNQLAARIAELYQQ